MSEFKKVVWHKVNVPVKHALINNAELGKVLKDQRADQQDVWQTSLSNPNFAAFASSCGTLGIRVEDRRDLEGTMQKLFTHDGPVTPEIITEVNFI
ncbi:MAG: thiamine pyrophosphate-dependent enzyme [Bacteroidota bacterium]